MVTYFYKVKSLRKGNPDTGYCIESSPLIEAELQIPGNRLNGVSDLIGEWRIMALRDPMPDYLLDPNSYVDGQAEVIWMPRAEAKALSRSWKRTGTNYDPITGEPTGTWELISDVTEGMPE